MKLTYEELEVQVAVAITRLKLVAEVIGKALDVFDDNFYGEKESEIIAELRNVYNALTTVEKGETSNDVNRGS